MVMFKGLVGLGLAAVGAAFDFRNGYENHIFDQFLFINYSRFLAIEIFKALFIDEK